MKALVEKFASLGLVHKATKRRRGRPPTREADFAETHRLVDSMGVSEACRKTGVSRQGYYNYLRRIDA